MEIKKYSVMVLMVLAASIACGNLITATEDATIKNGANAASNFGNDTTVWGYNQAGTIYKSYVKFDTSSLDTVTNINSVQAYWYDQTYDRAASVYLITNTSYMTWSENTITWNNAPGNVTNSQYLVNDAGIMLGSLDVPNPIASGTVSMGWVVGAKDILMNVMNNNNTVTLVLVRPTDRWVSFASTEAIDGAHPLRINVDTIPEPATVSMLGAAIVLLGVFRRIRNG